MKLDKVVKEMSFNHNRPSASAQDLHRLLLTDQTNTIDILGRWANGYMLLIGVLGPFWFGLMYYIQARQVLL